MADSADTPPSPLSARTIRAAVMSERRQSQVFVLTPQRVFQDMRAKLEATDPASCLAFGTGLRFAKPGTNAYFTIQARDASGALRSAGGDAVKVLIRGQSQPLATVKDNGNGSYTISYIASHLGILHIDVSVAACPIQGSPFKVEVVDKIEADKIDETVPKPVASIPAAAPRSEPTAAPATVAVHPASCTLAEKLIETVAGASLRCTIQARDAHGSAVTVGGADVSARLIDAAESSCVVADVGDGTYIVAAAPTKAGTVALELLVNGAPIAGSPFSIRVVPALTDVRNCSVDLPRELHVVAGRPSEFIITARDRFNNLRDVGGDAFVVHAIGLGNCTVKDNGDGTYLCIYSNTVVGTSSFTVALGSMAVAGSPYTVTVTPGPAASAHSSASGPGLRAGIAGQMANFVVEPRDAYHNRTRAAAKECQVTLTGPATVDVQIADGSDGRLVGSYRPLVAGEYRLSIALHGQLVAGSPYTVQIRPGAASGPHCEVFGTGLQTVVAGDTGRFILRALDEFSNPTVVSSDAIRVFSDAAGFSNPIVVDQRDGTHAITYLCNAAGHFPLSVSVSGTPLKRSPFSVEVQPARTSGMHCIAKGDGTQSCVVGQPASFVVIARDRFTNARTTGGDKLSVDVMGPMLAPGTVTDNQDGTYAVQFAVHVTGIYRVDVLLDGEAISGSPFTVQARAGATSMSKSIAYGPGLQPLVAGELGKFTIKTFDDYGNERTEGGTKFDINVRSLRRDADAKPVAATVVDVGNGRYDASFTLSTAGDYAIDVSSGGVLIAGSPFRTSVSPGPTSGAACTATGSGLQGGRAGEPASFIVEAHDAFRNARGVGGDQLEVRVTGAATLTGVVQDHGNGFYGVTYSPTVAGEYQIAVSMQGQAITGSSFKALVQSSRTHAPSCTVTGDGLTTAVCGQPASCRIATFDRYGNETHWQDEFTVELHGPASATGKVKRAADGSHFTASYVATVTGRYVLSIALAGQPILATNIVTVLPGATVASNCSVSGSDIPRQLIAGDKIHFLVQTRDQFKNNRISGGDHVHVRLTGASTTDGQVRDHSDGTYGVEAAPVVAGDYRIEVLVGDQPIIGSPFGLHVLPGAAVSQNCVLENVTSAQTSAGTKVGLRITAGDEYGNKLTTGGNLFAIKISGISVVSSSAVDNSDGTYTAEFLPNVAGSYNVHVRMGDKEIAKSPLTVNVEAAAVYPKNCSAEGVGLVQAVAGQASNFVVRTRDEYGNVVHRGGAQVAATLLGAEQIAAQIQDNGDGTYRGEYTPTISGTYQLNVLVAGEAVAGSPFIVVAKPGVTSAAHSEATGDGLRASPAGQTATLFVKVKDAFGNERRVGGDAVRAEVKGASQVDAVVTDNIDGTYRITYGTRVAGKYQLSILVNDAPLQSSPFDVEVTPLEAHPSKSVIDGDWNGQVVAGEVRVITVIAHDIYQNRVRKGGEAITVAARGPVTVADTAVDNNDGTYTSKLRLTSAGSYEVWVQLHDSHVLGSPCLLLCNPAQASAAHTVTAGIVDTKAAAQLTFTVTAFDEFGNRRRRGGDPIHVQVNGPRDAPAKIDDQADGTYIVSYPATKVGMYTVDVRVGDELLAGAPFTSTISPGPTDASRSIATGEGLKGITAGLIANFVLEARDAFDNARCVGGDCVEVKLTGPDGLCGSVNDRGDGFYTVSYDPVVAGEYELSVTLQGAPVMNSPFRALVEPSQTHAPSCVVTGGGLANAVCGQASSYEIITNDRFSNRTSWDDQFTVELRGPATVAGKVHRSDESGKFVGSYVATVAGRYLLSVYLSGQPVLESPSVVTVIPGPTSPAHCVVSGAEIPKQTAAGEQITFLVQSRDNCSNNRDSGSDGLTVKLTGVAVLDATVVDNGDGTYEVQCTPTKAGDYTINATIQGKSIAGAPFALKVVPGVAVAPSCVVSSESGDSVKAGSRVVLAITAADEYKNKLYQGGDTFGMFIGGIAVVSCSAVDNNDGTYSAEFAPSMQGEYEVHVRLDDKEIDNSPLIINVEPADVHPSSCTANGAGLAEAVAGENGEFSVQAHDLYRNLITIGGADVNCTLEGASTVRPKVTDNGNGSYAVSYSATVAGNYQLNVEVGEEAVAGSPFAVVVKPAATSAEHSDCTGDGLHVSFAGMTTLVYVQARDRFGNERRVGSDAVRVEVRGPKEIDAVVVDNSDGTYTASYVTQTAGDYQLSVFVGDKHARGSPFKLRAEGAQTSANHCVANWQALNQSRAGDRVSFVIQARDVFGDVKPRGGDIFVVRADGAAALQGDVKDLGNGTYEVSILPSVAGTYHIHAMLGCEPINESPRRLQVIAATTDAALCSLTGTGVRGASVSAEASFVLRAYDRFGNRRESGGDSVEAALSGAADVHANVQDCGDGLYTITYTVTVAGRYLLDVSVNGARIASSPFGIEATPAFTEGANCQARGDGLSKAIAGEAAAFTIFARDKHHNARRTGGDPFSFILRGPVTTSATAADQRDGSYTCQYSIQKAGVYSLNVLLDGAVLNALTSEVTVVPARTHAPKCIASGSGVESGVAGQPVSFIVTAFDEFGNERKQGGDLFSANVRSLQSSLSPAATVSDNGDGTHTVTYMSTSSGEHVVDIALDGTSIEGSPFRTQIAPAATSAAACSTSGSGLQGGRAGDACAFTLEHRDAFGNKTAASEGKTAVKVTGPATYEGSVRANADSTSSVIFTPTVAGAYTAAVTINEQHVAGSPFRFVVVAGRTQANKCVLSGEGLTKATAGVSAAFTVTAFDAFGNASQLAPEDCVAGLTGAQHVTPSVVLAADAQSAVVRYTASLAGQYLASVMVLGEPISAAPLQIAVEAAAVQSATSVATGDGLRDALAGKSSAFVVQTRDAFGNIVTVGGAKVTAVLQGPATVSAQVKDNGDGTYAADYTPTASGSYQLNVRVGDLPIAGSPFAVVVKPGATSSQHCAASGALHASRAGQTSVVFVRAKDQFGNERRIGGDNVRVEVRGPKQLEASVIDNGDGTYGCSYTTQAAGDYQMAVLVNDQPVAGSPFLLKAEGAQTSASHCAADWAALKSSNAGDKVTFIIQARDVFGERKTTGGDVFVIRADGTAALQGTVTDLGNGTYEAALQPTVAGSYKIHVLLASEEIVESPHSLHVFGSVTDAGLCAVTGNGLRTATAGVEASFVLRTYDRFGNRRETGGDTVRATLSGPSEVQAVVQDEAGGSYHISYSVLNAGRYQLHIDANGAPVAGSPFTVDVVSASTDVANCAVHGEGLKQCTAGESTGFTIVARDRHNNQRRKGGDRFSVQVNGPSPTLAAVADGSDGTYAIRYNVHLAGAYSVDILLDGKHIAGSPYAVTCSPAAVSIPHCKLSGAPTGPVPAGVIAQVLVTSFDKFGNKRASGGDSLHAVLRSGSDRTASVPVADNGDGSYSVSVRGVQSGVYTVEVGRGGEVVDGCPMVFTVQPADTHAPASTCVGDGLEAGRAGEPCQFTVVARDGFGNARTSGGDRVRAQLSGAAQKAAEVRDNNNGTYLVSFVPTSAGDYSVAVSVDGYDVCNSPFRVQIAPGVTHTASCTVSGDGVRRAFAGETASFIIAARDAFRNKRYDGGDEFAVYLVGEDSVRGSITDHKDGTYFVQYFTNVAGLYNLHVSLQGKPVGGSPFELLVQPTPTYAPSCTAGGTGLSHGIIVNSTAKLAIQARDKLGNERIGGGDTFLVKLTGAATINASVEDNDNGTYTVSFVPPTVGDYKMSITFNQKDIQGSPFTVSALPDVESQALKILEDRAKGQLQRYTAAMRETKMTISRLRYEVTQLASNTPAPEGGTLSAMLSEAMAKHMLELEYARVRYNAEIIERRRLTNVIQDLRGNLSVYCRVRPLTAHEQAAEEKPVIEFPQTDQLRIVLRDRPRIKGSSDDKPFEFQRVYDTGMPQEIVYGDIRPLVLSVLEKGVSAGVLAYGQSGSGKTHTLVGSDDRPGLVINALHDLVHSGDGTSVELSVVEIVDEQLRDLLRPPAITPVKLDIARHPKGYSYVSDVTMVPLASVSDAADMLANAEARRTTPHAISTVVITLHVRTMDPATNEPCVARLYFVDAADPEGLDSSRQSAIPVPSSATAAPMATATDRSIAALQNVVSALLARMPSVPWRDSRLTHLLKDVMTNEESRFVILCTVSPSIRALSGTRATLSFAARIATVELGRTKTHSEVLKMHGLDAREAKEAAAAAAMELRANANDDDAPDDADEVASLSDVAVEEGEIVEA
eukprot:TRINITY_DN457_c0_g1_i1.p1 TRINITY_DN457_c0_g1~~TRINITY_DN457_c0_g1_i1.p1  ORF type:complete len:4209 (-),score=1181.95 TRINITY_DN457_c0_g1_i1:57-12683(-)